PLFDTRAVQDSLLVWLGRASGFYGYLRETWRRDRSPLEARYQTFDEFWDHSLHDGVFEAPHPASVVPSRSPERLALFSDATRPPVPHLVAAWRTAAGEI